MPMDKDRKVQHAASDGLQRSTSHIDVFRKSAHARNKGEGQGWEQTEIADTLNTYRAPIVIVSTTQAIANTQSQKKRNV